MSAITGDWAQCLRSPLSRLSLSPTFALLTDVYCWAALEVESRKYVFVYFLTGLHIPVFHKL